MSSGPRKLLIASIGVATINYVASCSNTLGPTVANLPAPPPNMDAGDARDATDAARDAKDVD